MLFRSGNAMSTRQERFDAKKKKMSNTLHGSDTSEDDVAATIEKDTRREEAKEERKAARQHKKDMDSMNVAVAELKSSGDDLIQTVRDNVEMEEKIEEATSRFKKGRSAFESISRDLANGDEETSSLIYLYMFFSLCVPVGIYWWITENKACGIAMLGMMCIPSYLFVLILKGCSESLRDLFIETRFTWYKVKLKTYSPLASSIFGVLNFINWVMVQAPIGVAILAGFKIGRASCRERV